MPVDRSTLDRAPKKPVKLGPPAPPPRPPPKKLGPPAPPRIVAGGGGNFPPPYKPTVAAHDLPPTRDARQAPYAYVLGHPGERSNIPPAQQVALAKSTQGGKVTPAGVVGGHLTAAQTGALAKHLLSIPHPVERLQQIGKAQQAGVLPPSLTEAAIDTAHQAAQAVLGTHLSLPEKQNIIAGFPRLDRPTDPAVTAELEAAAKLRGAKIPANPTLSDLYQAKYGSKPEGWAGILTNAPRDFVMTPIYTGQGGLALGDALVRALPKSTPIVNAQGDPSALREIGKQQLDIVEHPKAFITHNPVQAGLLALGGLKGVGRGAAIIKNAAGTALEATPREIPVLDPRTGEALPPINGEPPVIKRGTLSTRNVTVRGGQKLSDALLARNPRMQRGEIARGLRGAKAQVRAEVGRETHVKLQPVIQAARKLSTTEGQRVLENEARGFTPDVHAEFRGHESTPAKPLSPAQQDLQRAVQGVEKKNVQKGADLGLLDPKRAARRAYLPAINVAARAGNEAAQRFLKLDERVEGYRDEIKGTSADQPDRLHQLTSKLAELQPQHDALLEQLVRQHAEAGHPTPVYVPEKEAKRIKSVYARPGEGSGIQAARKRYGGVYNAVNFNRGTYEPITPQSYLRAAAVPDRLEQAHRFANEVSDPRHGLVKEVTVKAGEQPFEVPEGYVAQTVRGRQNLVNEGDVTDPLHSLMSTFQTDRAIVHPGQTIRLWPTTAYNELEKIARGYNPPKGGLLRANDIAGQALRNALLYSRPAYPLTNTFANMIQSGIVSGTTPGGPSYWRAENPEKFPVPARVEDTGASAVNFQDLGMRSVHAKWLERTNNLTGALRIAGHPFAAYAHGLYQASVDLENWTRRAQYLKHAIPEARKLAHPDASAVQRFAMRFRPADQAVHEALHAMAEGSTDEARAAAERAVKPVMQALGDFAAMGHSAALSATVPFWRWTRFVSELMGKTLPLHYPGRTLLLYRLGALGQAAQHQVGPLTPSMQGYLPAPFGGLGGVLTTQALNPLATLGSDVTPQQGSTSLNTAGLIRNISPFAQIAYEQATGRDLQTGSLLRNEKGEGIAGQDLGGGVSQSTNPLDRLRLLGQEFANLVPPLRAASSLYGGGSTGEPDTSVPIPGLTQQGPHRATPQQPAQSPLALFVNQFSPLKYKRVDLPLMVKQGQQKEHASLIQHHKQERKSGIESIARSIAHKRGVDLSNRSTAAAQRVLQDAVAEYGRKHP